MTTRPKSRRRSNVVGGLLLAIAATTAFAVDPLTGPNADPTRAASPEPAGKAVGGLESCRSDSQKFCADVAPGGGRRLACLETHKADLAPACRDGLAKTEALRKTAPTR